MNNLSVIQTRLNTLKDYSASLEIEILSTQEQIQSETDETHITFLDDHLCILKYKLDKTNAEIYILRQKTKSFLYSSVYKVDRAFLG